MSEREPLSQGEKRPTEENIEWSRFLRRHGVARFATNILWRTALAIAMISTPWGRKSLRDPELRRFLFDKEARTGLLEDSIFSENLYYPNEEGTSLDFKTAVAGRWVGYDFNRPSEFGDIVRERNRQLFAGRIDAFLLEEIKDNQANDYTPTGLLELLNVEHLLQLDHPPLDELLAFGVIEQTTYQEAYQKVELYEKYRQFLTLAGVVDSPVYRITPKGNGLIFIGSDTGDKEEQSEGERELKPAFAT